MTSTKQHILIRLPFMLAAATVVIWAAPPAFAEPQESEAAPGDAPREGAVTNENAAEDADPDAVLWERFHLAEGALRHGDKAEALRELEAIVKEHPDSPAAAAARVLIQRAKKAAAALRDKENPPAIAGLSHGTSTKAADGKPAQKIEATQERDLGQILRDEQPTGLARAELAAGQTINGIVLGAATCGLLQCNDTRAGVASLMLGGAAGLTLSLIATSDGITSGHAAILNTGSEWGFWNGLALSVGSASSGNTSASAVAGGLILGQLSGLGAGELLYRSFHPSAGDVSLASSAGIWSSVLLNLMLGAGNAEISDQARLLTTLAVGDVALLGGAFLASRYPVSRGRALLIDVGGGLGLLMGVGGGVLIGGDKADTSTVLALGAAGTVVGLGLGAFLTRNWDVPDTGVQIGLAPTKGGAAVMVGVAL